MNRVSRPASRSGPLATAISDTSVRPRFAEDLPGGIELAAAAVDDARDRAIAGTSSSLALVGALSPAALMQSLEAALQHLAHHARSRRPA